MQWTANGLNYLIRKQSTEKHCIWSIGSFHNIHLACLYFKTVKVFGGHYGREFDEHIKSEAGGISQLSELVGLKKTKVSRFEEMRNCSI